MSNIHIFPTQRERMYREARRYAGTSTWYVTYRKTFKGGMLDGVSVTDELPVYTEAMADFWVQAHEGQEYRYDSLTRVVYTEIKKEERRHAP